MSMEHATRKITQEHVSKPPKGYEQGNHNYEVTYQVLAVLPLRRIGFSDGIDRVFSVHLGEALPREFSSRPDDDMMRAMKCAMGHGLVQPQLFILTLEVGEANDQTILIRQEKAICAKLSTGRVFARHSSNIDRQSTNPVKGRIVFSAWSIFSQKARLQVLVLDRTSCHSYRHTL